MFGDDIIIHIDISELTKKTKSLKLIIYYRKFVEYNIQKSIAIQYANDKNWNLKFKIAFTVALYNEIVRHKSKKKCTGTIFEKNCKSLMKEIRGSK